MKTQMQNVDAVSTINYQFTAIPTNLFYLLDNNTRTLLFTLIQSSSYFAKENGFFYLTKEAIGELTNLSINVITAAIDTLYINGLVQVTTVGKSKGKYVNHYKVNFEEFTKYEDYTFEDLKNPLNKIEMVKYKNNYQPQYIKDYLSNNEGKQVCKEQRKQERKKVITNIDNINNIENKNNIHNNINKKEEYNINIYKEKIEEVGLIENPTSNKKNEENIPMTNGNGSDDEDEVLDMIFGEEKKTEENNTAFQHIEVGMQTKEEESMTEKFEKNLNTLLDKLNQCTSIQDLEDKVVKLCGWVERCSTSYTEEELETIKDRISNNYIANQTRLEELEKIQVSIEEDFFNCVMLDSNAKTANQVKKESEETTRAHNTITKEELEKNINDFINSLPTYEDITMATTTANYITKKFDKEIREYGLMQLAMDMYTQIDAHTNSITSDLTDFNNQDIETTIDDEKTQEIASCEVINESSNIDDCIAALIEDLEPAVLDTRDNFEVETSTRLW